MRLLTKKYYFYWCLFAIGAAIFARVLVTNVQANEPILASFYEPIKVHQDKNEEQKSAASLNENTLLLLNDSVHHYIHHSQSIGIPTLLRSKKDISVYVSEKWLVPVSSNEMYFIDDFAYSYPYIIPAGKNLLNDIAKGFQTKLKDTRFAETRFVVSSMLRTKSSIQKLSRVNSNAIEQSAHLHGTAFDISYEVFFTKTPQKQKDIIFLKNTLASVLLELRDAGKCWVTYEKKQACFHIVVH